MADRITADRHYTGANVFAGTVTLPASTVTNAMIAASAGIDTSKLDHIYIGSYFKVGTVAASETAGIHIARAAGTVQSVEAFLIGANVGDSTVSCDVKKNGTTILSAAAAFSSSDAARAVKTGTISTAAYVDGDVFEVVITGTVGTGTLGTGLYVSVEFSEAVS